LRRLTADLLLNGTRPRRPQFDVFIRLRFAARSAGRPVGRSVGRSDYSVTVTNMSDQELRR